MGVAVTVTVTAAAAVHGVGRRYGHGHCRSPATVTATAPASGAAIDEPRQQLLISHPRDRDVTAGRVGGVPRLGGGDRVFVACPGTPADAAHGIPLEGGVEDTVPTPPPLESTAMVMPRAALPAQHWWDMSAVVFEPS